MKNSIKTLRQKNAFTLMEILVTVIIVGLIGSIALSRYGVVIERFKAKEAEQLVMVQYASLRRDIVENQVGTMICSTSDFIPVGQNFNVGTFGGGTFDRPVCIFGAFRKGGVGGSSTSFISTCPGGGGVGYWGMGPSQYLIYSTYEWCRPDAAPIMRCASGEDDPNICARMGYQ